MSEWQQSREATPQPDSSGASPPVAEVDPRSGRERRFWLRAIWISIVGVVVPPLIGLAGTVIGMIGAFGELSEEGTADPVTLAGDITRSMKTTQWGLFVSIFALMFLFIAVVRYCNSPKPTPGVNAN